MEEEMLSMISHAKPNKTDESSDSNCSIYRTPASKRLRLERYKGVVPQQNGHWGTQIYADHHRIWLGTFKSEIDAAMAYDSAAIKLRSGDTHRNFQWNNITIQEPAFQSHFTIDEILNMIRDGSYPSKFANFLRSQQGEKEIGVNLSSMNGDGEFSCYLLFQKELTPSDVGKLNRLVIPKRYAVKHFPNVPDSIEDRSLDAGRVEEVQLEFYDRHMRLWKFRYCYWKSSQSFVFTRGWNRFVKEKGLKPNDTIAFYMHERRNGRHFGQSFIVIDVAHRETSRINADMNLGRNSKLAGVEGEKIELVEGEKTVGAIGLAPNKSSGGKGFRLFGVELK